MNSTNDIFFIFSEICDSHTQDILNSFDNEGYLDKSKALPTINLFKCGN